MQQIVHDYIEQIINQVVINNCFNHEKNTTHEIISNSSDMSITPLRAQNVDQIIVTKIFKKIKGLKIKKYYLYWKIKQIYLRKK